MRHAPAADRNKQPIGEVLTRYPPFGTSIASACLEVASGTGQHLAHFAGRFPHVTFQPTEYAGGTQPDIQRHREDSSLEPVFASIVGYTKGMANVRPPLELDASAVVWPDGVATCEYDAVYAANVCHIAPYPVTEGLLAGAARVLKRNGRSHLFIYGPFMVDGQMVESNHAFDARLRAQDPTWGVREANDLAALAASHGLELIAKEEMPANNLILVFRRKCE
eukprot:Hpha_TRINITY_DN16059_c3_g9::TRINITY_DN16059_c3_g9_i2::g.117237::m.117237